MTRITSELIAIDCVAQLFWDYTDEDIQTLKLDSYFRRVWDSYVEGKGGQEAYQALWECWMDKFSPEAKQIVIDYAVSRFGQEKREGLEGAARLRAMFRKPNENE